MTLTFDSLTDALIAAHDGGPVVGAVSSELIPVGLDGIYAMQDAIIGKIGAVGGWKVMAGGEGAPMCSPIPANRYFADGETINAGKHRFIIAEIEVAVKLGADLDGATDAAGVEAAIDSVHPAIEFVGNPFENRDATDRQLQLGDLQSNGAVVVGPAVDKAAIIAALPSLNVTLSYEGAEAKASDKGITWQNVLDAVSWLSGHAAARGLPLKAGQVLITGARVLAPLGTARSVSGALGDFGTVTAECIYEG